MIKYVGVDWLTMTSQTDSVGLHWYELYNRYKKEHLAQELRELPFHNGYYGGVRIGSLKWGFSERLGYILIMSGSDANSLYDKIRPGPMRVTRLDLCVDIALIKPAALAQENYNLWELRGKKIPQYRLYKGRAGGDTLYVGSRQSPQMGRLYDKGVETGLTEPGKFWRFEVEYKKPLSGQVYEKIAPRLPTDRANAIKATVGTWYDMRGVVSPVDIIKEDAIEVTVEKRITTRDRKLAWLRTQVAPSVAQLVSAGLGKEVLSSLLLDKRQLNAIWDEEKV